MLLLTMKEWLGPGNSYPSDWNPRPEPTESIVAMCTDMALQPALLELKKYQLAYNAKYRMAVNFTLLSVQEVEPIDEDLLEFFRVERVETLVQNIDKKE